MYGVIKIMKVVDIANEIYLENASPTDTTIPAIAFWIRSNVGKLNTTLYEDFYVDPVTLEILKHHGCNIGCCQSQVPPNGPCYRWTIGPMATSIVKLLFKVYRVDLDIRNMLVSVTKDSILKASDQEFVIEKVNKSELLKTLTAFKKDTLKELREQVHYYRSYNGEPAQVAGDDTIAGHYVGVSSQYVRNVTAGGGEYTEPCIQEFYGNP